MMALYEYVITSGDGSIVSGSLVGCLRLKTGEDSSNAPIMGK